MPKSKYYYAVVDKETEKVHEGILHIIISYSLKSAKNDARALGNHKAVSIPASALNKFIKQYIPDKK